MFIDKSKVGTYKGKSIGGRSGKPNLYEWLYLRTKLFKMYSIKYGKKIVNFKILNPPARKEIMTQKPIGGSRVNNDINWLLKLRTHWEVAIS